MLDCCLRWSSARYYAAPGEVMFARCIVQRRFGASGEGLRALHVDTARWFSVLQRADIALLVEMLLELGLQRRGVAEEQEVETIATRVLMYRSFC
jgi:hypothetical protein